MNRWERWLALVPLLFLSAMPLNGQEARGFSFGVAAGAGGVQVRTFDSSWDFGPMLGSRLEWAGRRSAVSLSLDAQPFRVESNTPSGDFRALYLVPGLAAGSPGRRIGFGVGMGVFDFQGGSVKEGAEVGFVASLSGSARITGGYFVELGWKRINNVRGVRANLWTLQLVHRWRTGG